MTVLANSPQSTLDDEARYTPISDAERATFGRDGFLLVPGALTADLWSRAVAATELAGRDLLDSSQPYLR